MNKKDKKQAIEYVIKYYSFTWSYGSEWNNPMANKLPSFLKSGDSQRGQSWEDHLSEWSQRGVRGHGVRGRGVNQIINIISDWMPSLLTFLKTMGSSSHTGLMALLFWEVLVFSAFLLVSAGSPNMSTSTYTPTRRSVRNWPEITWRHGGVETDSQRIYVFIYIYIYIYICIFIYIYMTGETFYIIYTFIYIIYILYIYLYLCIHIYLYLYYVYIYIIMYIQDCLRKLEYCDKVLYFL